jgi:dephospho-CoA kinase
MLTVGLTGGVSAGKSTVGRLLSEGGARHLDADHVAHELLSGDPEVRRAVVDRFGEAVLGPDGVVDRGALGRRVFGDPDERRFLEGVLHPRIQGRIEAARQAWRAEGFAGVAVVEAALTVEAGRAEAYDVLLVVEAPFAVKLERQVSGGFRDRASAEARLAAQAPAAEKLLHADIVIWNDGDPPSLATRVAEVWRALVSRCMASPQSGGATGNS